MPTGIYQRTEEHKKNLSESQSKVIHTKEWNRKVSEARKGKPNNNKSNNCFKIGHPRIGEGNWKGGVISSGRYIKIFMPEHKDANRGYILEHRYIVEQKIGRYLNREEQVHHLDEDKHNNDINNLMLFENASEHIKFHNKVRRGMTNYIRKQIEERWSIKNEKMSKLQQ